MGTTPLGFAIGTASAALQIEGDMPPNNWSAWAEAGHVKDGTSTDVTTGHWHRWREDNELMSRLGLQIARISVEWARIEPRQGRFDHAALARYREEIEDLVSRGIQPLVTLHHFGQPLWFESLGSWEVEANVDRFLAFVTKVVETLGDLVSDWVTINEPNVYATAGYLFNEAPPGDKNWVKLIRVSRNLALAHVLAYRIIHGKLDAPGRTIRVTFAHHKRVFTPKNPRNPLHQAFNRFDEFMFHRIFEDAFFTGYFHPILGRPKRKVRRGMYCDVIAINYYSRTAVTGLSDEVVEGQKYTDLGWEIYPQGIVQAVAGLHKRFNLPIWITENGTADNGGGSAKERFRCSFLLAHFEAMAASGLPFERYYHWCFVDNWEWTEGMIPRFGIVWLDRETLERTPKPSAHMLSEIIAAGAITDDIRTRYSE